MDQWIKPHVDISSWEFYDLSCKARDATDDKVLADAVSAGKRMGSIFKEPTVTPSATQAKAWGLKKAWGSPNGAMRRGWNGITISRDTIHIEGVKLGFDKPVFFERHAVGGAHGTRPGVRQRFDALCGVDEPDVPGGDVGDTPRTQAGREDAAHLAVAHDAHALDLHGAAH